MGYKKMSKKYISLMLIIGSITLYY